MKLLQHQCEETLKRVQDKRHEEKHQKIGQTEVKRVEKKMASVNSDINTLDEEFPEITQEQQTFIFRVFINLPSLLGSYVGGM